MVDLSYGLVIAREMSIAKQVATNIASGRTTQAAVDAQVFYEKDSELVEYQGIQSRAFAAGLIPLRLANHIYENLGGECPTLEKFNKLPFERKMTLLELEASLVAKLAKMGLS